MNRFTGIGRLTRDPEYTVLDSGNAFCKFRLAINKFTKTKDGEFKEKANFINIKTWGRLAEICRDRLEKGKMILADGEITTYSGERKDGTSYHGFEVFAKDIIFMQKPCSAPQAA
jgi:single-strand DNA-binding protein